MDDFKQKLAKAGFKGELDDSAATKDFYSHDASLFEIRPRLVVFPRNGDDVEKLVKLAASEKSKQPELSLTGRSAGTDMSGGAINDSIIVDFQRYFNKIEDVSASTGHAQPGV